MPRRQRHATAGIIFHVLNRGARRMQVFESPGDYYRFLELLGRAQRRTQVDVSSGAHFFRLCRYVERNPLGVYFVVSESDRLVQIIQYVKLPATP